MGHGGEDDRQPRERATQYGLLTLDKGVKGNDRAMVIFSINGREHLETRICKK
jgi:hypothetical protein